MGTNAEVDVQSVDKGSIMHPFSALHSQSAREALIVKSAEGVWLTDATGRRYLDAAAGLWCVNVGYGRSEIVEAAAAQMRSTSFAHSFSNFTNEPLALLTERLLQLAPAGFKRILYGVSGSDANDTQIKLVRRYNNVLGRPSKKKIIARAGSYHGSTIAAGSLTGLSLAHRSFDIPMPGVLHTGAADYRRRPVHITSEEEFSRFLAGELHHLIEVEGAETVAAFMAEPIVGAGGVLVPPAGYFREIARVLKQHDVLMIADEVITGFGRTGDWFASPHFDVQADMMTISKGMTSGYFPMSACLVSERVVDVLYGEQSDDGFFGHGFTAAGHPVGAVVALANIDIMEAESLPNNAAVMGSYLLERLRQRLDGHELVADIRGHGLMVGVEFSRDGKGGVPFENARDAGWLLGKACLDEGLLVRGAHGRVVAALAPPLVLNQGEADEIVSRLERAVERFTNSLMGSEVH